MRERKELKIDLDWPLPRALFIRKNEAGIDLSLTKSFEEIKKKYPQEKFLELFEIPKAKSEKRLIQFAESRRCLLLALNEIAAPPSSGSSGICASISHTEDFSGALVCLDSKKETNGVGLDLESSSRDISPEVEEKFTFESEKKLGLTPLELWTVKEASYKANSLQTKESLFQYEVKTFDLKTKSGTATLKKVSSTKIRFRIYNVENLIVTVAIARLNI